MLAFVLRNGYICTHKKDLSYAKYLPYIHCLGCGLGGLHRTFRRSGFR